MCRGKYNTNMKGSPIQNDSHDYDYDYDDGYDAYGDFGLHSSSTGGGGGSRVKNRNEKRGGSQGSGSVYSAKHTRLRDTRRNGSGSSNK
mmetsp:Transcript_41071/g.74054  ORF Transcript_41071/g.74054 Transcript_41071/m.74054 type:complete len:89 (+) Transcript_41071:1582-1848(+)